MGKTLVGPQLRQLRRDHGHTQAEMARRLHISPAYVNLLENNQRALSVQVLMALIESYGVDMREIMGDRDVARLADLRTALSDAAFAEGKPDLQELRGAVEHAPRLVDLFLNLYRSHRRALDHLSRLDAAGGADTMLQRAPETAIHDFFRENRNHFPALEAAADDARDQIGGSADDMYTLLKRHLRMQFRIEVALAGPQEMGGALRSFDRRARRVLLSEVLDHPNRVFQLAHVVALAGIPGLLDELSAACGTQSEATRARCRVELANHFAAALLMPYDAVLEMAEATAYDIERIAAAFGLTFEQVCHRLTTLQRDGARGVAFFLLRLDRAGNVTKRVNATPFALAEKGGACPVWNIHEAFATPGRILPQLVELPDGAQFFTIARTTERPDFRGSGAGSRQVVALGCARSESDRVCYARMLNLDRAAAAAKVGLNCHLCPRQSCEQRAHEPTHFDLPLDANRRGRTRYES